MPRAERKRNWCFTWNNPPVEVVEGRLTVEGSSYLCYQIERGENAGTVHAQGVLCFSTLKSMAQVKSLLPLVHLEVMRGTIIQAVEYCRKEDTRVAGPWEQGERPKGTVPPPGEWEIARA